jgi:GR25 family glycosyltransferase involved in LPS biosynthesis
MLMAEQTNSALMRVIDGLYIVNLESRPDRRRDMEAELTRIGLQPAPPFVTFFRAIRPDAAGAFPSIGARGCFLSQLGVLREARSRGQGVILLLEDDAVFTAEGRAHLGAALAELNTMDWGMAYLGHRIASEEMPGPDTALGIHWRRLEPDTGVVCAHAVVIHQRCLPRLIAYLERMLARPAGDPEGGPMHVDGAYSWFRRDHPDLLTVVTPVQYVVQRASRSDITPQNWKEKLPFVSLLRQLKNSLSRKI